MESVIRIKDIFQIILATNIVGEYYDIKMIRMIIHKLATINKSCNNNFSDEDNMKFFISLMRNNNPTVRTHYGMAKYLGSTIAEEIKSNFNKIINRIEINVTDPWYGNATMSLYYEDIKGRSKRNKCNGKQIYTLLSLAVMMKDLNAISRLLEFKLPVDFFQIGIVNDIFVKRQNKPKNRVLYFTIIQLLLEANKIPKQHIAHKLELTTFFNDEQLIFLLKKYQK